MTIVKILISQNDDRTGTITNFPIYGIHQWVSVLQHMKKKWNCSAEGHDDGTWKYMHVG